MKRIFYIAITTFSSLISPALGQQYPTIVGDWYDPRYGQSDCGVHFGISIQPMGMKVFDEVCSFDTVRRDGWKVTWTGQCTSRGEWSNKISVIAVETRGRLRVDWPDGTYLSDLRRCPK